MHHQYRDLVTALRRQSPVLEHKMATIPTAKKKRVDSSGLLILNMRWEGVVMDEFCCSNLSVQLVTEKLGGVWC